MSFNRPTLQEIQDRLEAEAKGLLEIGTLLRRSFLYVIARVMAGISHLLHGHLDYNSKQFLPTTMSEENLIAYGGKVWGIKRNQAVAGVYTVGLTGVNGSVIPANTIFKRSDNKEYYTLTEVTIASGVASVNVQASEVGIKSELLIGDGLSLLNAIAGVDSSATVSAVVTEPENIEDIEAYRARVIARIQNPISGGTATDYVQWAKEVAGVTRAWVLPQDLGAGTVGVRFVEDSENPITPSAAKVTEVQNYIDEKRPVTANVTVSAPVLFSVDMTINLKPNTADVQTAVENEIKDLILRDAALRGAYKNGAETYDGKILLSKINEAISLAVGEEDHEIVSINSVAPADVVPPDNNLVVLGTITWQPLA